MKRLIRLGVALAALSLAGPAAADGPIQSAAGSLGTVQVGSAGVAAATTVNAPVTANAPVNVASTSGRSSSTSSGSAPSATSSSSAGGSDEQSSNHSIGTVQVGSANVSPATAANAPVTTNTPVSVLSDGGSTTTSTSNGGGANASAPATSSPTEGDQSVSHSVGTVQVGSVHAAPATAVDAPVTANAPVDVLSSGSGNALSHGTGPGAHAAAPGNSGDGNGQNADHSIGTAQVGSVDVSPATAVNAPVAADGPVNVLSDGRSSSASSQGNGQGASAAAPSHDGNPGGGQSADNSVAAGRDDESCGCGSGLVDDLDVDALARVAAKLRIHRLLRATLRAAGHADVGTKAGEAKEAAVAVTVVVVATAKSPAAACGPALDLSADVLTTAEAALAAGLLAAVHVSGEARAHIAAVTPTVVGMATTAAKATAAVGADAADDARATVAAGMTLGLPSASGMCV